MIATIFTCLVSISWSINSAINPYTLKFGYKIENLAFVFKVVNIYDFFSYEDYDYYFNALIGCVSQYAQHLNNFL